MPIKRILTNPMGFFFTGASLIAIFSLLITTYLKLDILDNNADYVLYHMHELSFGFFGAGIIGFILTAIPNWTGGKPIQGLHITILGLIWLTSRILWALQGEIVSPILLVFDLLPLAFILCYTLYCIYVAKYIRGIIIFSAILIFFSCQVIAHYHIFLGDADTAYNLLSFSLFIVITLVAIIGGRITPNFTRGYLNSINSKLEVKDKIFLLPIIIIATINTGWVLSFNLETDTLSAYISTIGAIAVLVRMSGWKSFKTINNPLLFMLHTSYFFFVIAFTLTAISGFTSGAIYTITIIHIFSIGLGGTILISVMMRASKGHNGLPLKAKKLDIAIYSLILLATTSRLVADYLDNPTIGYHTTKTFWILAFILYLIRYVPIYIIGKKH